MVIAKITGGLGNQLFQYAFARRVAIERDEELILDTSFYSKYCDRKFQLDAFKIQAAKSNRSYFQHYNGPFNTINNLMEGLCRTCTNRRLIKETSFQYREYAEIGGKSVLIEGYWQSEKYFRNYADIIIQELEFELEPAQNEQTYLEQILSLNSVAVHVRRGDYLNQKNAKIYNQCSMNYYRRACKIISSAYPNVHFFIFSDDLSWVQQNFLLDAPHTIVESKSAIADMMLMSRCQHNIIANSTFSWWSAYLNLNANKTVVSPANWFTTEAKHLSMTDLLPAKWLKLPN